MGDRAGRERERELTAADAGGVWPCAPVRRAIERSRSEALDDDLFAGVRNRRGARWVARDGSQESIMARTFRGWREMVRTQYPRTGTILRHFAEYYEGEAQDERERGDVLAAEAELGDVHQRSRPGERVGTRRQGQPESLSSLVTEERLRGEPRPRSSEGTSSR